MGEIVHDPLMKFDTFRQTLLYKVGELLEDASFKLKPIQDQILTLYSTPCDIIAIAPTKSGKTLGYLITSFIHLSHKKNDPGPTVLVLAPTGELAACIQKEANRFGQSFGFSCACLRSGAPMSPQLQELKGAHIVVATPGRLNDFLEMKKIDLKQVSLLVHDEADLMLDLRFQRHIRKILKKIPRERKTHIYSVTCSNHFDKFARSLLINPKVVKMTRDDDNKFVARKDIKQLVEMVNGVESKKMSLRDAVHGKYSSKVLIFCSTIKLCDEVEKRLGEGRCAAIHGDKSQGEKGWILDHFRSGFPKILVATDVAVRGADMQDLMNISLVISYDIPSEVDLYVDRINHATQASYTIIDEKDVHHAGYIIEILEHAGQVVPRHLKELFRPTETLLSC